MFYETLMTLTIEEAFNVVRLTSSIDLLKEYVTEMALFTKAWTIVKTGSFSVKLEEGDVPGTIFYYDTEEYSVILQQNQKNTDEWAVFIDLL